MVTSREKGQIGELIACDYLELKGWIILDRNYHCRFGEIDIVCRDLEGCIVFCEVKYYHKESMVHPLEMIGASQIHRLKKTIGHYLFQHKYYDSDQRIDVILIENNKVVDSVSLLDL